MWFCALPVGGHFPADQHASQVAHFTQQYAPVRGPADCVRLASALQRGRVVNLTERPFMTSFESLGLAAPLLQALATEGYTTPTPIQSQAIPHVMTGHDLQGIAQTGTGKTAAFALPILHRLMAQNRAPAPRSCRVLVLAPTRELASQIAESFRTYGRQTKLRTTLMFGGVPKPRQARAIAGGIDILVATPGRLLDHLNDRAVRLDLTEILVLDEADHMLDLGFIVPIRKIAAMLPDKRQTLFFSATMPKEIGTLAN